MSVNAASPEARGKYGFTCWHCRQNLETPFDTDENYQASLYAAKLGWKIGHYDGQGEIECPECEVMWDPMPLWKEEWNKS